MLVHTNKQLVCGQLYLEWHIPKWCATSCKYGKIFTNHIDISALRGQWFPLSSKLLQHATCCTSNPTESLQVLHPERCNFSKKWITRSKSIHRRSRSSGVLLVSFLLDFPPPAVKNRNSIWSKDPRMVPPKKKDDLELRRKNIFSFFNFMTKWRWVPRVVRYKFFAWWREGVWNAS